MATTIMISTRVNPRCDLAKGVFIYIWMEKSATRYADVSIADVQSGPSLHPRPMTYLQPNDYEALAELRYLGRKFLRFSRELLRATAGLNPEQYEALLAIKASASATGLTISELSERLQVKHHSAVNIVDRLVERQLVTRQTGETDRRRRHVELTAKGEKLIQELAALHWKELRSRNGEMIRALERLNNP